MNLNLPIYRDNATSLFVQPATKATSCDLLVAVASWKYSFPSPAHLLSKIEALTCRMDSLYQDYEFSHRFQ